MIRRSLEGLAAEAETLVIGSGPAGLTLALELDRRGLPSLVLESGTHATSPAQDLSDATIVDPARHDAMAIAVARRLGGTSNLWGGRCVPLDPIDFVPRRYAQFARWPIGHDDIAPFYREACGYASCGAPVFQAPWPGARPDAAFAMSHLERSSNAPRFHRAHRERLSASRLIDLRLDASVVAIELGENGRATHVVVAGADGSRRTIAAKQIVVAAGGVESARLLLALQRRHPDLFGGPEGSLGRYYMGHIIGEIADVVLAPGVDAAFDFFLDGNGSFARRRFTPGAALAEAGLLPNMSFWPVVPPIADPRHRSGALSALAMALSTPIVGRRLVPEAIRSRHLNGPIAWSAHARNVALDLPQTLGFLGRFAIQRYLTRHRISGYFLRNGAHRYGLTFSGEQSPRADSRVSLSEDTDRHGVPRVAIDLRFHREDAEAVVRLHDEFGAWLAASGLGALVYRQPRNLCVDAVLARASHGTHQIGLARMGADRRSGVVDGDLRTFDVANLFVASSAVFPTSGQANPTLSIVAFAARLAALIAREAGAAGA